MKRIRISSSILLRRQHQPRRTIQRQQQPQQLLSVVRQHYQRHLLSRPNNNAAILQRSFFSWTGRNRSKNKEQHESLKDCVQTTVDAQTGLCTVTLNRPNVLNAIDMSMFVGIAETLHKLKQPQSASLTPNVRAVLLQGAGRSFCAGLDVQRTLTRTDAPRIVQQLLHQPPSSSGESLSPLIGNANNESKHTTNTTDNKDNPYHHLVSPGSGANLAQIVAYGWRTLQVPVVCAIQGHCYGAGLQIALGCDIRFAAPNSKWAVLETKWGLIPDMGAAVALRELVRADIAKDLTFTGRIIDGTDAAALGLVTFLDTNPQAAARQYCIEQLIPRSPDALTAAKTMFQSTWQTDNDAAVLHTEASLQRSLIGKWNQVAAVGRTVTGWKWPYRSHSWQKPTSTTPQSSSSSSTGRRSFHSTLVSRQKNSRRTVRGNARIPPRLPQVQKDYEGSFVGKEEFAYDSSYDTDTDVDDDDDIDDDGDEEDDIQERKQRLDVAVVGLPNAGKSQLLNVLTQSTVSAVSRKRHTTRRGIMGARTIVDRNHDPTQIVFVDTPGFLRVELAKQEGLRRDLVVAASSEMTQVDCSLLVVDAAKTMTNGYRQTLVSLMLYALQSQGREERLVEDIAQYLDQDDEDVEDKESMDRNDSNVHGSARDLDNSMTELAAAEYADRHNTVELDGRNENASDDSEISRPKFAIVLNKVDLVRPKPRLLDIASDLVNLAEETIRQAYEKDPTHQSAAEIDPAWLEQMLPPVFYTSALRDEGVDDVLDFLLSQATPSEEWPLQPGHSTTMTAEERIEEIIREKLYRCLHKEVPYSTRQTNKILKVGRDRQGKEGVLIQQVIEVRTKSHWELVMGSGGRTLERIRETAVRDLEALFKCPVKLLLSVKHTKSRNREWSI